MTNRAHTIAVLVIVVNGLAACGGSEQAVPGAGAGPSAVASPPAIGELVSGTVSDSGLRPLSGARVELVDGPQTGISATTDHRGEFSMTALVDDSSRFRASKDGHVAATATIQPNCAPCNPKRWVHFYLNVLEAPVALAGNYMLTFVADGACGNLPDALHTRRYAVTVAPGDLNWPGYPPASGTSFRVTPRGANFPPGLNLFYLNVAGSYVSLSLGDHTDPGITERVESHTYFAFGGSAVVTSATPVSSISTPFQGWIDHCVNPRMGERYDCMPSPEVTLARCESRNHQLILTRQ